jgi:hypothetical protein
MTIQKSPSVSPIKSRWIADDLYQLLNEVIVLRATLNAVEAEIADRSARFPSIEKEGLLDGSSARLG